MCSRPLYGLPGLPRVESALAIRQSSQSTGGGGRRFGECKTGPELESQDADGAPSDDSCSPHAVHSTVHGLALGFANGSSHWRPQTRCSCWPCVALSLGCLGRGTRYAAVRGHEQPVVACSWTLQWPTPAAVRSLLSRWEKWFSRQRHPQQHTQWAATHCVDTETP